MNYIRLKIAALAIVSTAICAPAGHAESPAIRNCTWCHGASAQGYTPAPRLAGQRARYIEQQLMSFSDHRRDTPFSKQYMWGATASLNPQTARDLAVYFSRLPHRSADDGDRELVARGEIDISAGYARSEHCRLRCLSWPERTGCRGDPSARRAGVYLPEKTASAVGRGIQRRLGASNASHCEPAVAKPDRRAGVVSQLRQIASKRA